MAKFDQYGRPIPQGYGYDNSMQGQTGPQGPYQGGQFAAPNNVQAKLSMPSIQDLGGQGAVPWIRFPYYPTAPFYSTDPRVGTQTRFYGATLTYTDADFAVNTEAIRSVQFDIPCRLIAINASSVVYDGANQVTGYVAGIDPRDQFLFRVEYTTGDRLHTAARLGSTVVGSFENPGEIGGVGYTIDQGASLILGITPLVANIRIDITLVCLEIRGASNFVRG
jgi:hypothetical protein